jgi:O-antigen/teichoic acid export membrane protein
MKKTPLGRGTIYLMFAQFILLVSGYAIHVGLGRFLGPASYGIFGIVIYLLTFFQDFLRYGIPQAASKFIAEDNRKFEVIKEKTLKLQLIFSLIIFLIYFSSASLLAKLLGDYSLGNYLRASAFIIPIGALYSLYGNYLNGLRWYKKQAIVQSIFFISKVFFVFFFVFILARGFEIYGAILGYAISPLIGFLLAFYYLFSFKPKIECKEKFESKKIIDFSWAIIIFSISLTFPLSIDLFLVKRILTEDALVGFYTASSTLARVPFFILSGLGLALFPAISEAVGMKNFELTKNYIRDSLRYSLLLLIPITVLMSANSSEIISLFYSNVYLPGSSAFSILVFGLSFLTIFLVLTTIINASGRPKISMVMALILVIVSIFLNLILIPNFGLKGAAIATTITTFLGLIISAVYVLQKFKTLISPISFFRVTFASFFIYLLSINIHMTSLFLPFEFLILFSLYVVILVLLKEINKNDFKTFQRILPRRLQGLIPPTMI